MGPIYLLERMLMKTSKNQFLFLCMFHICFGGGTLTLTWIKMFTTI